MRTVLLKVKNIFDSFRVLKKTSALFNVPYFSQWESPNLVDKILKKEMSAKDDPKWKDSGAKDKEEYGLWSWNSCGMACLKMILVYKTGKTYPTVNLGKLCMEYGAYKFTNTSKEIDGLFYKPFIVCIEKEFGIHAKLSTFLTAAEIIHSLDEGKIVIASVHPSIRDTSTKPATRGGHLVLIVGYNVQKQLLIFHNPSGNSKETQAYAKVSFSDFKHFFANRGMIIL